MVPSGTLITSVSLLCDLKWRCYAILTILRVGEGPWGLVCGGGFFVFFFPSFPFLSFEY